MARKIRTGAALAGALVAMAMGIATPTTASAHMVQAPCDFITSGGFVFKDDGGFVNFGAHGGCKNGEFWGNVNVEDHDANFHLMGDYITGYLFDPDAPNRRDICGWGRTNSGYDMQFRITLEDNGEPGTSDEFGIVIDTRNQIGGDRFIGLTSRNGGGGNVQLHKGNRSNSASELMLGLKEWQMCGDLNSPR